MQTIALTPFAGQPAILPWREPPAEADAVVCGRKDRRATALEFIRSARHSLMLSMFRCDDLAVLHELAEAVARGVGVEVLITGRAKGWGRRLGPLAGCLSRMGVRVIRYPSAERKYHAKFMVADGRRAIISTMNLTRRCLERTQDFLCVTADPELTGALTALFCADSKGLPAGPEARHPRLILGPDHARERIETLLRGARQSIRILDHKLSDPRIIRILEEQRRRGLEVDVIAGGGSLSHGRMILVDRQTAVLGSFALSERSLDARRELATLIHEPALITQLERRLEKMARRHA